MLRVKIKKGNRKGGDEDLAERRDKVPTCRKRGRSPTDRGLKLWEWRAPPLTHSHRLRAMWR